MIDPVRSLTGARPPAATRPIGGLDPTRPLRLTTLGDRLLSAPTLKNRISFHVSPEASKAALLDAIAKAEHSFCVETYIWTNDAAGKEIMDALAKRKAERESAGHPFAVRVLVDGLGTGKDTVSALKARGFEVQVLDEGASRQFAPITHRKLYIADGTRFLTGGRNLADEYLNPTYANGTKKAWKDLLVTVSGEETGRVRQAFVENWVRAGGSAPTDLPPVVPDPAGRVRMQSVGTNPHRRTFPLRELHTRAIEQASREIVLTYPYLSDDRLIEQLINAKRKNPALAIKVMIPAGSEGGGEGILYSRLNQESANQLLRAGVEVRTIGSAAQFSHMKAMVVDRELVSIGSANGDARTYEANHELNVVTGDPETAERFYAEVLGPEWIQGTPVTPDSPKWHERLFRRVLEALDAFF